MVGAGSKKVPHASERIIEPKEGSDGSVMCSPKDFNDRLNFSARGLRSAVSYDMVSATEESVAILWLMTAHADSGSAFLL